MEAEAPTAWIHDMFDPHKSPPLCVPRLQFLCNPATLAAFLRREIELSRKSILRWLSGDSGPAEAPPRIAIARTRWAPVQQ